MVTSTVTFFDKDVARVSKDKCSVLVIQCGLYVVIVREELVAKDSNWVLNTYLAHDTGVAYEKWLHWIGKMCKKELSSKYFANYQTCPSFTNGRYIDEAERKELLEEIRKKISAAIVEDAVVATEESAEECVKRLAGDRYHEVIGYLPECWHEMSLNELGTTISDYLTRYPTAPLFGAFHRV